MMYKVIIKKDALKELKLLPRIVVADIAKSIEQLSDNPRPSGCKKLKGSKEDLWRIRIGNYRVIYVIEDIVRIVNIRKIGHRKDVYN